MAAFAIITLLLGRVDVAVGELIIVAILFGVYWGTLLRRRREAASYLEQLVRLLRKAGLVTSVRGAGGGYRLAKPADSISVGDVLRALEGNLDAVSCGAFQKEHPCRWPCFGRTPTRCSGPTTASCA